MAEGVNSEKRIALFGRKKFKLSELEDYFAKSEHCDTPEKWEQFNKENPYLNVFEIDVSYCYDKLNKEFYCHCAGAIGGCGGDFFYSPEGVLDILRTRKVPERHIPVFLKKHKEIAEKYLAGDTSVIYKPSFDDWQHVYIHGVTNLGDPENQIAELKSIIKGFECCIMNRTLPDEDLEQMRVRKGELEHAISLFEQDIEDEKKMN